MTRHAAPALTLAFGFALAGCPAPAGAPVAAPSAGAAPSVAASPGWATLAPGSATAAAPATAEDVAAIGATAMAIVQASMLMTASDAELGYPPFTTLATGDGTPTVEQQRANITKIAKGTFTADLARPTDDGFKQAKTSADPADASIVTFKGAGGEPLHGLTLEFRGFTPDWDAKYFRSQIAERQGLVMWGGKNLFAQGVAAAAPAMAAARAAGFGADAAGGTTVSYRVGANTATEPNQTSFPYRLDVVSKTVPQASGDLTLGMTEDKAKGTITITLRGPYTAKAPGGDAVIASGTLDQTATAPVFRFVGFFWLMDMVRGNHL